MKMVLFVNEDWADEFDYPIYSVVTEEELADAKAFIEKQEENYCTEFYFGTNEAFEFTKQDLLVLLNSAKPATAEKIEILEMYVPRFLGLDLVEKILDEMYDASVV